MCCTVQHVADKNMHVTVHKRAAKTISLNTAGGGLLAKQAGWALPLSRGKI